MLPFLRQLEELARNHKTDSKWVFVPRASLKLTLPERLLHRGCDWVNFRFITPFDVALEMAAPALLRHGIRPKPEDLGPTLVTRLMRDIQGKPYFKPLLSQPGMDTALWSVILQLRMAGLSAKDLLGKLRPEREDELRQLLSAYQDYLAQHKIADRADVFALASRQAQPPTRDHDLLVEVQGYVWPPVVRTFLDSLPGQRQKSQVSARLTRRLKKFGAPTETIRPSGDWDVNLLAWLGTPLKAPPAHHDDSLCLFAAGRRDAEFQEIKRRICQQKIPIDEVEILLAQAEAQSLAVECFTRAGWPVTVDGGLPVVASRPGRALVGLMDWLETDCPAYRLHELLCSHLLSPGELSADRAARILERSGASVHRASYLPNLTRVSGQLRRRSEDPELDEDEAAALRERAEQAELLAKWIGGIFKSLPDGETVEWSEWVEGLVATLDQAVVIQSEQDAKARARLKRFLDELLLLDSHRLSRGDFIRTLRQKLADLRYLSGSPRSGQLHIGQLGKSYPSGRPFTFVVGLEEGAVGRASIQDAVLSDAERTQLHPGLALSDDLTLEANHRLIEGLGSLDGQVTLSYSNRDVRNGQELLPSWLIINAARLLCPNIRTLEDFEHHVGRPVGLVDTANLEPLGWWLRCVSPQSKSHAYQAFPFLSRGAAALVARERDDFTEYDGYVESASELLDPRRTGEAISVSRLQKLATCPFRYFLEQGLGLREPQLELPDGDRWLDPATRGSVLHDVYAAYYRGLRAERSRPDKSHQQRLAHLLEAELQSVKALQPAPSEAIEAKERAALLNDLETFLRLELQSPERFPIAFEVGFGMPDDEGEPLAVRDPVELDFGSWSVPLRGKIDRIDRIGADYEVVDYKTGRKFSSPETATYDKGRLLQHAVYAHVAQSLLEQAGVVRKSSYYFPTSRAERRRFTFDTPSQASLRGVLEMVLAPLVNGAFVHAHDKKEACKYCDFQKTCRAQHDGRNTAKLENQQNRMLASRRRLLELT